MTTPAVPPVVVELATRLLDRLPQLASSMTAAILEHASIYRMMRLVPEDDLARSCEDHLSYVLGELAGLTRDTSTAREVGRRRAEQGVPLDALLHAYRIGARYVATRLLAGEDEEVVRRELTPSFVQTAWEMLEDYTQAVTTAYLEAVGEQTRRSAEARSAAVGALLDGQAGPGPALVESARSLGLPLEGSFVVVTVRGAPDTAADLPTRATAARLTGAWRRDLDGWTGVVQVPARGGLEAALARLAPVGPERGGVSAPYDDLVLTDLAAHQAQTAADCAEPGRLVAYDDAPVPVLLAGSPDAAAHLVRRVLGPLLALPEREAEVLLETLRTWFAEGGSASRTAAALYVHRNTVGYRVQQVSGLTGRSLGDPRGAAELYLALEALRLGRGVTPPRP